MKSNPDRLLLAIIAAVCSLAGVALPPSSASAKSVDVVSDARTAIVARDYDRAHNMLAEIADESPKAARMLGVLYRDERVACDDRCTVEAAAYFERAARAGDLPALVAYSALQADGEAGAPTVDDVVAVERARAAEGDAVSAWRLVRRIDAGEIEAASTREFVTLLETVAAEKRYPRSADAAYKLCQHHVGEAGAARIAAKWCEQAAEAGMPAAALALYRFKSVDG